MRTYNFPQSRITDHRINFTTHRLSTVLEGDLEELIDQVTSYYNAQKLKDATGSNGSTPEVRLHQVMSAGRARLVAAGVAPAEAAIDVDLFVRTIRNWDWAQVITAQSESIPSQLEPRLDDWLARRARHEPAAYIVGTKEFWGLEFRVTSAVLVPRPETELIVEEAVRLFAAGAASAGIDPPRRLRLADVGTGSGCIAVSLARELPHGRIVATDISLAALAVARENAERHGVADRVAFVASSFLEGADGSFDAIAANPPYVSEKSAIGPGGKPWRMSLRWRCSEAPTGCAISAACSTPRRLGRGRAGGS